MAANNAKLNGKGKVDILARAMADVFQECMERTRVSAKQDLGEAMEVLGERIDTTNENMQAQFAQHRRDVSSDMRRIMKKEAPKPARPPRILVKR